MMRSIFSSDSSLILYPIHGPYRLKTPQYKLFGVRGSPQYSSPGICFEIARGMKDEAGAKAATQVSLLPLGSSVAQFDYLLSGIHLIRASAIPA